MVRQRIVITWRDCQESIQTYHTVLVIRLWKPPYGSVKIKKLKTSGNDRDAEGESFEHELSIHRHRRYRYVLWSQRTSSDRLAHSLIVCSIDRSTVGTSITRMRRWTYIELHSTTRTASSPRIPSPPRHILASVIRPRSIGSSKNIG